MYRMLPTAEQHNAISLHLHVEIVQHTVVVGLVCLVQPEVDMLIIQQRQTQDYCQQVEEVVVS